MAVNEEPAANRDDEQPIVGRQPPLFEVAADGRLRPPVAAMPELTASSPLEVARWWFRNWLEQNGHPPNTVESYSYDLSLFQQQIGAKPINQLNPVDIARFLERSGTRSTRKRRLTSIGRFFDYLVKVDKLLTVDPSDEFFPEHIPLKTPNPLFENEREAILAAATREGPRTEVMVMLMLLLGLGRSELLAVKRDHIDLSDPSQPVVYVFYENPRWRGKERKLAAPTEFAAPYQAMLAAEQPTDRLFELLPQTVNKLVERVARKAGLTKRVTPQLLRDTYAVYQARQGASEDKLLALLGLADDPRNRVSVQRYLKLAAPALG